MDAVVERLDVCVGGR